jgi:primosomal protein N' (replication factor Y)
LFAEIALLNQAIKEPLTYQIPSQMITRVRVGMMVGVQLGTRITTGLVLRLFDKASHGQKIKPIQNLIGNTPILNSRQIELAKWMSAEYYTPIGRCLAQMIPPGLTPNTSYIYELNDEKKLNEPDHRATTKGASEILSVLRARGAMLELKLKMHLGKMNLSDWQGDLEWLVQKKIVTRTSILEAPKVRAIRTTLVQLVISAQTLEIVLENLDRENKAIAVRRANALRYIHKKNGIAWADWLSAETGASREDLNWLNDRGYIMLGDTERWRDPLADVDYIVKTAPPLTPDQERAWQAVRTSIESRLLQIESNLEQSSQSDHHFLLRGVTGSGKTEVYMRAVEMTLARGRGAIILVPEISLTPQTSRRFLERFPGKVALIHSRLRPGERYDTWRRIQSGELPIVVGARSALFAPVPDIGLIVLDEEHENSYKQDRMPAYDARFTAAKLAELSNAVLIYGSATPSLELWYAAQQNNQSTGLKLALLELPNRVRAHVNRVADQQARLGIHTDMQTESPSLVYQPMPEVQLVDMRAELRAGNTSIFSTVLSDALAHTLSRGEQAILFLNRRGLASCVVCRDCGHAVRCPNDDVPLTLHNIENIKHNTKSVQSKTHLLKCHHCNHSEPAPKVCPACNSSRIRHIGIGTQRIEQAIHELHPKARIVRWDKDTSSSRGAAQVLLNRFINQQADVMVGTQMIAKGLDLPMVTLVGVVLADVGLFLPDFRASERVFNLIEQVAGRAGRGLLKGRVIVQTYNPDHPTMTFAKHHDVQGFAKYELMSRRTLDLPPYTRLVKFECEDNDVDKARLTCETLARQIRQYLTQHRLEINSIIGPAPSYFARRNNKFRWQIIARTNNPQQLLACVVVPDTCRVDVDPINVL